MPNNTLLANMPVDLMYGVELLAAAGIVTAADEISRTGRLEFRPGLVATRDAYAQSLGNEFVNAIAKYRHWEREPAL